MDEKAALEMEFQKRMKEEEEEVEVVGEEREDPQNTRYRSQHTQTVNIEKHVSPPQQTTISHTPYPTTHNPHSTQHITHPPPTPHHTAHPKPTKPLPMTTPTETSITPNTKPSKPSTVAMETVSEHKLPVATSTSHVENTADSVPTAAMETVTNTVPRINVETVGMDTVVKTTKTGDTGILELMENLINKVITNQSDFFTADSSTLHRIHGNLQNICDVILSFLHPSTLPVGGGGSGEGGEVEKGPTVYLDKSLVVFSRY